MCRWSSTMLNETKQRRNLTICSFLLLLCCTYSDVGRSEIYLAENNQLMCISDQYNERLFKIINYFKVALRYCVISYFWRGGQKSKELHQRMCPFLHNSIQLLQRCYWEVEDVELYTQESLHDNDSRGTSLACIAACFTVRILCRQVQVSTTQVSDW